MRNLIDIGEITRCDIDKSTELLRKERWTNEEETEMIRNIHTNEANIIKLHENEHSNILCLKSVFLLLIV